MKYSHVMNKKYCETKKEKDKCMVITVGVIEPLIET